MDRIRRSSAWRALLFAALAQHAWFVERACATDQPDAPLPEITAQQLAEDVRKALDHYAAAYLEAEFDEERNAQAIGPKGAGPPEILRWPGKLKYASDGRRWRAELESKTISFTADRPGEQPTARLSPRREVAGFDGERHYLTNRFGGWIVGEENLELAQQCPADLFLGSLHSSDTLLETLVSPRTNIVAQEVRDGFRCYVAEFTTPDGKYRQRFVISPRQSHLAVRVEEFVDGAVHWSHELAALTRTGSGLWYPGRIVIDWRMVNQGINTPFVHREMRVTTFEPGRKFTDDDFRFQPTFGQPVRDCTTGKSWFHDPWWPDIEPVLAKHDWPRADLTPLNELASRPVTKLENRPPPVIDAARWINSKPIEWQQLAGQVTVVHFFGGRLIEPTPRQLIALRRLHELYFASGLEVIAIAASTHRPEQVEQLAAEFDVRFPIAIDAPVENGPGKTFRAFGLDASPATFLVDPRGTLGHVERGMLAVAVQLLLQAAGVDDLPRLDIQSSPGIPDQAVHEIAAVWPEMVRRSTHNGLVSGRVTDGQTGLAGAEAVAELNLRVLSSPNVMQTVTTPFKTEKAFRGTSNAHGAYELSGLPKGIYEVTFAAAGKARAVRQVIIKPDLAPETLDVVLDQDDGISGRVVDDEGRAVAGARIFPRDWHFDRENPGSYKRGSLGVAETTSDEQGHFVLDKLYQGAWSLEITADGFEKAELAQIPPGKSDLVVKLRRTKAVPP